MSRKPTTIINLPFPGFYDSWLSGEIDSEFEQWVEYEASDRQTENNIPKELQLDEAALSDIAFDCMDYHASYLATAQTYVCAFNTVCEEFLGFDPNFQFEKMESPREYNFYTDAIYCYVTKKAIKRLFAINKADDFDCLKSTLERRHTSYDGFISFYSNDPDKWLDKPLDEWDYNELCSLLIAAMEASGYDETGMDLYYATTETDGFYHEFEAGMDWQKLEQKISEARELLAADLKNENPDYVVPYRCDTTQDMLTTKSQ